MHTNSPEFEADFYEKQNLLMIKRYKIIFKKNKKNWNIYFKHAKKQLRNNIYWIWIFLCGLEKFLKENPDLSQVSQEKLNNDATQRIARIIGNYFKIKKFIDSL